MARTHQQMVHATQTSSLADLLERILDKGIVIAGDIKIKLVDVELLTIQLRLVVASVDKAREMGIDWWSRNPDLCSNAQNDQAAKLDDLKQRIVDLEQQVATKQSR